MHDSTRDPRPTVSKYVLANTSAVEGDLVTEDLIEFNSDGFTHKSANYHNINGVEYIYMAFADTRDKAFWWDMSGNDNHWTPTSIEPTDIVIDVPNNNFAVLDNGKTAGNSIFEGNLNVTTDSATYGIQDATISFSSGKYYFEVAYQAGNPAVGINALNSGDNIVGKTDGFRWNSNGNFIVSEVVQSVISTWNTAGDIIGIAVNADDDEIKLYKNGVLETTFSFTIDKEYYPSVCDTSTSATASMQVNFGQSPYFGDRRSNSGGPYADANGIGQFYYQPPTGHLALCENNIVNDTTNIEYPDVVWCKGRTIANSHVLSSSLFDPGFHFNIDVPSVGTNLTKISGFHKHGFMIGSHTSVNDQEDDFVAFQWKGTSNISGSTTGVGDAKSYTGKLNYDAGFSFISYTGNGQAGQTIPHHLGTAPEFVAVGKVTTGNLWQTWATSLAADEYIRLDTNGAIVTDASKFGAVPDDTVFTLGGGGSANTNNDEYFAWAITPKEGFSAVGTYTGTGVTYGAPNFIYTGFRPRWVMIKKLNASQNWYVRDTERDPYNPSNTAVFPDLLNVENSTSAYDIDLLSNGFKLLTSNTGHNALNHTYLYVAFAEQPFKYANAR